MAHHVFDMSERATHELVAQQLRDLADQFMVGSVDLAYDEAHTPLVVTDPVDVVVDLTQNRHHVQLEIKIGWKAPD